MLLPTRIDVAAPVVRLDPGTLADIVTGLGASEALWRSAVHHDTERHRPELLLATDAYDVWVVAWRPDEDLDLHDHGESAGVVLVVDGELAERSVIDGVLVDDVLVTGRLRWVPPGVVHGVANRSGAPAVSIHAYSPPLSSMTEFAADGRSPVAVDVVDAAHPVLGSAARSLHPARG